MICVALVSISIKEALAICRRRNSLLPSLLVLLYFQVPPRLKCLLLFTLPKAFTVFFFFSKGELRQI